MSAIRALVEADVPEVIAFGLRAWTPVHESMAAVLGPEVFGHLYRADWRGQQERDIRKACNTEPTWVYEIDGQPVGFISLDVESDPETGAIDMLAVDPDYQRRGIGTSLTAFGVDQIRAAGKKAVVVETGGDPGHAPARATYAKAGFISLPISRSWLVL